MYLNTRITFELLYYIYIYLKNQELTLYLYHELQNSVLCLFTGFQIYFIFFTSN